MSKPVGVFLAGAVVGVVAGLGVASLRSPAKAPGGGGSSVATVATKGAVDTTPPPAASLAAILSGIAVEAVPHGEGIIRGTVRKADGSPLSGAVVIAMPMLKAADPGPPTALGKAPPAPTHVVVGVTESYKYLLRRKRGTVRAVSEADGTFALTGLADDTYTVLAYCQGYDVVRKGTAFVYMFQPGDTLDLEATQVFDVPVTLELPDGIDPATVLVKWSRSVSGGSVDGEQPWLAAYPKLQLFAGRYTMHAVAGEIGEFTSPSQKITVSNDGSVEALRFVLAGQPGIRGVVSLPQGETPQLLMLHYVRQGSTPKTLVQLLESESVFLSTLERRSDGYPFHLPKLRTGTYLIGVGRGMGRIDATLTVVVGERLESCELKIPEPKPEHTAKLRVLGPSGETLSNVTISVEPVIDPGVFPRPRSGAAVDLTEGDGSHRVFLPRKYEGTRMTAFEGYTLSVTSEAYGSQEVKIVGGQANELVVRFQEPAKLVAMVAGFADSPYAEALHLKVRKAGVEDMVPGSIGFGDPKLDPEGRVDLGPLEPGDYDLILVVKADAFSGDVVSIQTVSLLAGLNEVKVAIPPLQALTVFTSSPGVPMVLRTQDGERLWNTMADAAGSATFRNLSNGRYEVRVLDGPEIGRMEIEIPSPAQVTFKAEPIDALRVTVVDPQGYLAQAGFKSGDLIVRLAGKEFHTLFELQALMREVVSGGPKLLIAVKRGAETLDLTTETTRFTNFRAYGGQLEPVSRGADTD